METYVFIILIIEVLILAWVIPIFLSIRRYWIKSNPRKKTIGDYVLIRKIGKGGMAGIYLAFHSRLNQNVVIKILNRDLMKDKYIVHKFIMEGKNIEMINNNFKSSPVVKVLEYGLDKKSGRFFIAMEYLKGDNLKNIMNSKKSMSLKQKLFIIKEVARALQASHALKIIHRNISPENIIIHGETVTLIDFGISKEMLSTGNTPPGIVFGALNYISPEQLKGEVITEKSDIYALGVLLYYMIEGKPPYDSSNPYEIINRHFSCPTPKIKTNIFAGIKKVIYSMLEKNPDKRPEVNEIIDKMSSFLTEDFENV
jgi:eukaryotic-like serine/threonine-protein kinase